jgi:tetratricopeptide (TPR) repeat protein
MGRFTAMLLRLPPRAGVGVTRSWAGVAFAVWILISPVSRAQQPKPVTFDELYRTYAAGEYDVIELTVPKVDYRSLKVPDAEHMQRWLGAFDRRKAAFLLEFATASTGRAPGGVLTMLSVGRAYVMSRPAPLNLSHSEDAFEIAWHKSAMALLESWSFVTAEDVYLESLTQRFKAALDPRFVLQRAIAEEQRCASDDKIDKRDTTATAAAAASKPTQSLGDLLAPVTVTSSSACLAEAKRRFALAAVNSATAAEANTRGAWVQFQAGQLAGARTTIEQVDATDDADLMYWTSLFRGRIYDAVNRLPDAERAYRAALEARPAAQSAAIGLSFALFRMDRKEEARALAVEARRQPDGTVDPWWIYIAADARFLSVWRADLRAGIGQ